MSGAVVVLTERRYVPAPGLGERVSSPLEPVDLVLGVLLQVVSVPGGCGW
jgi:hypothetical protein